MRPRGVPRPRVPKVLSLCSQRKSAVGGHTPWVETLGLPWADSTEAGSPYPLPLVESASSLVFYAGGPEMGRGGGCRWEWLKQQTGESSHPPCAPFFPLLQSLPGTLLK